MMNADLCESGKVDMETEVRLARAERDFERALLKWCAAHPFKACIYLLSKSWRRRIAEQLDDELIGRIRSNGVSLKHGGRRGPLCMQCQSALPPDKSTDRAIHYEVIYQSKDYVCTDCGRQVVVKFVPKA